MAGRMQTIFVPSHKYTARHKSEIGFEEEWYSYRNDMVWKHTHLNLLHTLLSAAQLVTNIFM